MSSEQPTTVILPLDLGAADKYDQLVFPLAVHHGLGGSSSNVNKGSLLLSATLEEMVKIKEMGLDLSNSQEFIFNTRVKYEALAAKRAKLQNNQKTLNPFKVFRNYRAARVFHAASFSLYLETKETSEKMQRDQKLPDMQTVPSAEMHAVNDIVPTGAPIRGIAISLPGALNDDAIKTIFDATNTIASHASDPFVDNPHIPQMSDEDEAMSLAQTESLLSQLDTVDPIVDEVAPTPTTSNNLRQTDVINPSASPIINVQIFQDSVFTANSSVRGLTVNRGSRNSGASMSQ